MLRRALLTGLVLVMVFRMMPAASASAADPFLDVDTGDYYYSSVLWAYTYEITAGKTADMFLPAEHCTREQIVTFLWRLAGKPEPASMDIPFTDVPADRFAKAILWAAEKDIATGYPDGTFRPDEICTRKHAMTFLWRYFGQPESSSLEVPFPDVKPDRFRDAISWAVDNGITQGYKDGNFCPERLCSRAEIVTFLYRSQHPQLPSLPEQWIIECNNSVSLYKNDYAGASYCTIPKGKTVELLGWSEYYAYVRYGGYQGYVYAPCLRPLESPDLSAWITYVEPVEQYSYESMLEDLQLLRQQRPWLVSLDSIGVSELGRDIPVIRIGREDAAYHVLLHGAIHGREYMTAWLLMAMAEFWSTYGMEGQDDVCYHIIPMVNPDGVYVSQTAELTEQQKQIYYRDYDKDYTDDNYVLYSRRWKANGLGVDLNRNFPSGWYRVTGRGAPSSQLYKGTAPFSAAETAALRDYTLRYDFDATLSYHSSGSVIYYEYGDQTSVNTRSKSLARAVEAVTGYPLEGSGAVDGAGYKDWAIEELRIPSLTVEVGVEECPLALREIYSIFARNLYVMPAVAQWLQEK